ncbi:MAG: HPr kinase/phosphatase C-terminal domain-containing protein [Rhodospirillales bacterium]|nr:HPr kinase/phosphatase C-terminal domain-containing protein [Rhodospirillales bacterium]
MFIIHSTAISLNGDGILIKGPSGSGKTDLALRLIESGGKLISDDQVIIKRKAKRLFLSSPKELNGLMQLSGIGIVKVDYVQNIPLELVVKLQPYKNLDPFPINKEEIIKDLSIPTLSLYSFAVSATAKIKVALDVQKNKVKLIE